MKDGIITFLETPVDDPDREARITETKSGSFHIRNANMPYIGTLNMMWSRSKLKLKIAAQEVSINFEL